jgi:sec-independent protein translocase protein TatC
MTLGEHLGELRGCLVRSLVALVVACVPCFWLARPILQFLARPVVLANQRHGQPESFLATSPVEAFLVYVKVALIAGVVLAAPYIIYQLWSFVAAGLYEGERRWVRRLAPLSVALFMLGVTFMYTFVLLLSLNFLVGFAAWLKVPDVQPSGLERLLLGERAPPGDLPHAIEWGESRPPVLRGDPATAPLGAIWFNEHERALKVQGVDGIYALPMHLGGSGAMMTSHFRIGEYLTFVLLLTVAFGCAFQTPLVVLFLARSGIVALATLRRYRKVVIFIIVVIAGILAPPDILSHLLLSAPMYLLFELGMLLAARTAHRPHRAEGPP